MVEESRRRVTRMVEESRRRVTRMVVENSLDLHKPVGIGGVAAFVAIARRGVYRAQPGALRPLTGR